MYLRFHIKYITLLNTPHDVECFIREPVSEVEIAVWDP